MKWFIKRDAGYHDHMDWVEWKQTTALPTSCNIMLGKSEMHQTNTVLVGSVSYFSWLRIKLQALSHILFQTTSFPFVLSQKILKIFLLKS